MKVYLAASFNDREGVILLRDTLVSAGYEVTSSWLDEPPLEAGDAAREAWEKRARANEDQLDIERSDVVVVLSDIPSSTGGYHWEMGFAHGRGIPVILCGPLTNVFHYQNHLTYAEDRDDLLSVLDEGEYL